MSEEAQALLNFLDLGMSEQVNAVWIFVVLMMSG